MSKCLYCHQRKGKRACPALRGVICSQCCGINRITNISCPTSCVFLESNDDYQQKRAGNRFELERRGFYRQLLDLGGERATEIFYVFEALAYRFFQDRRDAEDAEVLEGLQSLRRSFSLIQIPEAGLPAFGEELRKEFKVFGERQALEPTLVTNVLDQAHSFIQKFSGSGLRSHRFLHGLLGYIRERHPDVAEQLARQTGAGGRIIIPSGFEYAPDLPSTEPVN
ncbi:hypothetical protein [Candidatus Nitrospira allomarina]|uniref:Uncharacterized protein n=1 Tax=Candidatus Nitrospira allomarina TaxID=3020900 RepID=A0AA96GJB8_9BACT|nr:hypothetical protein [Candidatus Nitrospira allomarina]WNM59464.1 hypothetical protein PP769_06795 [Candidatus Nitrospira allomarina]